MKEIIMGSLIKFFPISFWIVLNNNIPNIKFNFSKMEIGNYDDELIDVKLTDKKTIPINFPIEPIHDDAVILFNKDSCYYATKVDNESRIIHYNNPIV